MLSITAQVSLYPLRQEALSPVIDDMLEILREHSLHLEPGSMSSLITGDDTTVFAALRQAFCHAAEQGQMVMVVTFSNACPLLAESQRSGREVDEVGLCCGR